MARPITRIVPSSFTEQEKQDQSVEKVRSTLAQNADGIQEAIKLLQELYDSGLLEAITAALEAKEDIAKILVGQVSRPPVTNMINNAMAAAGALTELRPEMTQKVAKGVAKGLQKAEEGLRSGQKVGLIELMKALSDPDINRALGFGINLLKGLGEGLKEDS